MQQNRRYLCCLAKMAFNKSHFGMGMVTRGHLITIKSFAWGQPETKAKVPAPSPPLAPLMQKLNGDK